MLAYVKQVLRVVADIEPDKVRARDIESNIVRCPDQAAADVGVQPCLDECDLPITRFASQLIWCPAIARENEPVDHITTAFLEERLL